MLVHFQKKGVHFDALCYRSTVFCQLRLQAPRPQVEEELPAVMRAEEQLTRLDREVVGMLVDDTTLFVCI